MSGVSARGRRARLTDQPRERSLQRRRTADLCRTEAYGSLRLRELVQKCPGISQLLILESFGEPGVDRLEQLKPCSPRMARIVAGGGKRKLCQSCPEQLQQ
jgi:hypothetical protein